MVLSRRYFTLFALTASLVVRPTSAFAVRVKATAQIVTAAPPVSIASDASFLYVLEYPSPTFTGLVQTFTLGGGPVGSPLSLPASLTGPVALAWDGATFWVADASSNSVVQVDGFGFPTGSSFALPTGGGPAVRGMTWDGSNLWVAFDSPRQACAYSPAGSSMGCIGTRTGTGTSVAWDASSLWSATTAGSRTSFDQITTAGVILSQGVATLGGSGAVVGIAASNGMLYVLRGNLLSALDTIGQTPASPPPCPTPNVTIGGLSWSYPSLWFSETTAQRIYSVAQPPCVVSPAFRHCGTLGSAVAADGTGNLWVADANTMSLYLESPVGQCLGFAPLPAGARNPTDLEWDGISIWLSDATAHQLLQLVITPGSGGSFVCSIGATVPVPSTVALRGVAWDGSHLWYLDDSLDRIVPINTPSCFVSLPPATYRGLTFDGRRLWVGDDQHNLLVPVEIVPVPAPPSVFVTVSSPVITIGQPLTVNARLVNGSGPRTVDVFGWLQPPNGSASGLPHFPILGRTIPIVDRQQRVFRGVAGSGVLGARGAYVIGLRFIDSTTGDLLSESIGAFRIP
jgi:hypothetical protein